MNAGLSSIVSSVQPILATRKSLRVKFVGLLLALTLAGVVLAAIIGDYALNSMRTELGLAYARDVTLLKRAQILEPISRDLALSIRMGDSDVIRQWLADEQNPEKRALAMRDMEGYRKQFLSKEAFVISARSNHYYFNGGDQPLSDQPRYTIDTEAPDSSWYPATMQMPGVYNTNVNFDAKLNRTNVWMNVLMRDGDARVGLVGTGVDLTVFLKAFIDNTEAGVTPIIINQEGAILAHPNRELISKNAAGESIDFSRTLASLGERPSDRTIMNNLLQTAQKDPGAAPVVSLRMNGKNLLLSATYVRDLKWYVLSAVDLSAVNVLSWRDWLGFALAALGLLLGAVLTFALVLDRLVVRPLIALQNAAETIAAGSYETSLPSAGQDEIGALTRAFAAMTHKVQRNTENLEATVAARTGQLVEANLLMQLANTKIADAISYASRIQDAILPHRELTRIFAEQAFVLWKPRDIVGGDFYLLHEIPDGLLIGVVDCAGHSVPGALMTMLARAAFDNAIAKTDARDPAAVLLAADVAVRSMLHVNDRERGAATTMDAALVFLDARTKTLTFAGAKLNLLYSNAGKVHSLAGGKRALADRKQGNYENQVIPLADDACYFLCTDGLPDQNSPSDRNGFGSERLHTLLESNGDASAQVLGARLLAELQNYQADAPQRDDITVLCFRASAWRQATV